MTYVFDLDGTLIDSTKRHWMLMKELLLNRNIRVPMSFANEYMEYKRNGYSGFNYLMSILQLDSSIANEIQNEWVEHIEDNKWLNLDTLYFDTNSTLQRIKDKILFLTIRENKEGLKKELERLSLNDYEAVILDHKGSKADVLRNIGNCIMIGDTEVDYRAAIDAGCVMYILNRGFRNVSFWSEYGIRTYCNLLKLKDI